jgi:hypothetical protein
MKKNYLGVGAMEIKIEEKNIINLPIYNKYWNIIHPNINTPINIKCIKNIDKFTIIITSQILHQRFQNDKIETIFTTDRIDFKKQNKIYITFKGLFTFNKSILLMCQIKYYNTAKNNTKILLNKQKLTTIIKNTLIILQIKIYQYIQDNIIEIAFKYNTIPTIKQKQIEIITHNNLHWNFPNSIHIKPISILVI